MSTKFVSFFDPTKENLPYTLGIIKPDTCFKQQNVLKFFFK